MADSPPQNPRNAMRDDNPSGSEPFPELDEPTLPQASRSIDVNREVRDDGVGGQSSSRGRIRSASKKFEESEVPTSIWVTTGQIASKVPSIFDIRRGSFDVDGWSVEGQVREKQRRTSSARRRSLQAGEVALGGKQISVGLNNSGDATTGADIRHESLAETADEGHDFGSPVNRTLPDPVSPNAINNISGKSVLQKITSEPEDVRNSNDTSPRSHATKEDMGYKTTPFDNGYQFPPKHTWQESTIIFFKAFWKFFLTPIGFLVVVYGLNVVAWGGMLFLLLCNAAPAMCHPTCNDINSPRRIWIEITCQIVNALFCVTGFGTIPWRFRDLYYLLCFRIKKDEMGLRRLAGINRGWFRLAGSQELPVKLGPAQIETEGMNLPSACLPYPLAKSPDAPLTGVRAPPTALWKLDFVIWSMVWNTFLQAVLSGLMWGMNRYNRPSWSTGLFVALACIVAGCGGIMTFVESKKVKAIEGVPVSEKDQEKLIQDRELGIVHFNNIKDEKPKEPKERKHKRFQ
ncbi:alpha-L-rhamnosidase C protein [Rutstroemia sp. NJR-2017a WRK4]|nr:alpha-L-rhamnosidase C protein [Rutstroemia sp. NJR-2017a WRK4]